MKKTMSFILTVLLVFSLTACGDITEMATANESIQAGAAQTELQTVEDVDANVDVNALADEASGSEAVPAMKTVDASAPVVYFTSDISSSGLVKLYNQLGWKPTGKLAVKVSTGEPPSSNYLRQDLIGELVKSLEGTYVECLTAYGGQRSRVAMAKQVAADHGFSPFDLLDEDGSMTLKVSKHSVISENYVGKGMANYGSMLVLSHFKGHSMAGFGGAIKNISIGLGTAEGKAWIHSGGTSKTNPWGGDQTAFTESMAEAASTVQEYYGDRIIYINVMNRLSIDCDCDGNPAEPDIHDIGILASTDPVALDQACVDLIYQADGNTSMVRRIENKNGIHTLEHAANIGLGSREYQLKDIDKTASEVQPTQSPAPTEAPASAETTEPSATESPSASEPPETASGLDAKVIAKKGKKNITVKTEAGTRVKISLSKKMLYSGKNVVKKVTTQMSDNTTGMLKYRLSKRIAKGVKVKVVVTRADGEKKVVKVTV